MTTADHDFATSDALLRPPSEITHGSTGRAPNSAEPTRTCVAPKRIAVSKSSLMPMLSSVKPVAGGDLRQEREVHRRLLVDRRDAHEAAAPAGRRSRARP